jgi:polyribonucleotide nucleotidyltransferase
MDAGVPVKKHVAGIAMGIASDSKGRVKVLADIQYLEDGKGGMDFKIAGTRDGITAIQMDTKTRGLSLEILEKTLVQGKEARFQILDAMEKVITAPRAELSPYAPRIYTLKVDPAKIRLIIGPQGKVINEIIDKTGVAIEVENDGSVFVTAHSQEMGDKAIEWIKNLTREVKPGEMFDGKVTRILNFGAMVEILPNTEGLVHISNLANYRVGSVEDVVKIGDAVRVQVVNIDDQGRVNLCVEGVECQPPMPRDSGRRNNSGRGYDRQKRERRF